MHRSDATVRRERAVLAAVLRDQPPHPATGIDPLEELRRLAEAAGATVVDQLVQVRDQPVPATYMGKGKVDDLHALASAQNAQVVIFENDLSPSQIRNIEQVVGCKVIDRSELILDIFAGRARTHEAKLQVELAQLEYTYPRLRAMWSHLERITGGNPAGIGTRGPGEQQIEIDRRIVQRRKADLRREIARIQQRKQREVSKRNTDHFTVGLVGYTNAGKSTLFNTITGAGVYADDRLFATLDTRTRRWELGGGDAVMVSDTVGFVANLPHHLVASFKATLEESIHSDLLLVVLDITDRDAEKHLQTVVEVLDDIGAGDRERLLVLNKIDRLADRAELALWLNRHPGAVPISAATGVGIDTLVEAVRGKQRGETMHLTVRVALNEGRAVQFLENRASVHDRRYGDDAVEFDLTIGRHQLDRLRATGARFEVLDREPGAART